MLEEIFESFDDEVEGSVKIYIPYANPPANNLEESLRKILSL